MERLTKYIKKVSFIIHELWYLVKRGLRYVLYENFIVRFLRNKFLQLVLPGFSGAYFLCLDIYGDQWDFIKDNKGEHEQVFFVLIVILLTVLIVRGIAEHIEEKGKAKYINFIENFTRLTSKIVKSKLERFKESALIVTRNGDTFKQITKPKDQINLILNEVVDLLDDNFSIKENEQCITIMHLDPESKKWYFKYNTQKTWNNTKADLLMKKNSTAKECLEIGEPIFHSDKSRAARMEKYHLSERDRRFKVGSVFCYPVCIQHKEYEDQYIISIITYGKVMCSDVDTEHSEAIKGIFSDICRRIDLELTLESIKDLRYDLKWSAE
jgi:hypothetical protein